MCAAEEPVLPPVRRCHPQPFSCWSGRGREDMGAPLGEAVGCLLHRSRRLREVGPDWAGKGRKAGVPGNLANPSMLSCPAAPSRPTPLTFAEVSKDPRARKGCGAPRSCGASNRLLQRCELNRHTTEAAAGALQNVTAGDRRVRRVGAGLGRMGKAGAAKQQRERGGQRPPAGACGP